MRTTTLATAVVAATVAAVKPRYLMYFDQWDTTNLPDHSVTAGVTHVSTAFAASTVFSSGGWYEPFMPLDQIRALFDDGVKTCMSIGGWGDTSGFSAGAQTNETRRAYAQNVAATVQRLGYDCVDIDWEYPGGNGQDYKQMPNSEKVWEIDAFPLLLQEIKSAIGDIELSVAAPGRVEDMMAYTAENVAKINTIVDHVNVMTYDLMMRRMNATTHHSGVANSLDSVNTYIERGLSPSKMSLGFAFYAKWFATAAGCTCTTPVGCPTAELETPEGGDTGLSGAVTFEASTWGGDLQHAVQNGVADEQLGGQWYWDPAKEVFWTWDTAAFVARKFTDVVVPKGLGGVMAWALAQDSLDWSRFKAIQAGVKAMQQRLDAGEP
ncbi:glycoside hydrolase family 18 protein [Trichoderma cornu-damae]|uniref:chitinase n=1 Tax=Trichoderma cornu-damae TaxID=654480 RepID=A0A9P8QNT2_9HYPO|nr:glycoside hydrolase family 18 protein [Trichoderma cornu-damae]